MGGLGQVLGLITYFKLNVNDIPRRLSGTATIYHKSPLILSMQEADAGYRILDYYNSRFVDMTIINRRFELKTNKIHNLKVYKYYT